MTDDKELQYQARIRELVEALVRGHNLSSGETCQACIVLSRTDDLSALEAYVREEKRKVLEEVAKRFEKDQEPHQVGAWIGRELRLIAEELK